MKSRIQLLVLFFTVVAGVAGCATQGTFDKASAENRYISAKELIVRGQFDESRQQLHDMSVLYPSHDLTHKLQLDLAFAYSEQGMHEDALALVDLLIARYPDYFNIADAYYLRGVSLFNRYTSRLKRRVRVDDSAWYNVRHTLQDFINRFPNNNHVANAQNTVQQLDKLLAAKAAKQKGVSIENKSRVITLNSKPTNTEGNGAVPSRGMRKEEVANYWGQPDMTATSPVPRPITRWFYDGLVV